MVVVYRLLKIARSRYYALRTRPVDVRRMQLRPRIRELHQQSRGAARGRMLSQLRCRERYMVSRWLARKLMQECGLESRQPGRHRHRGVKEEATASPDLLRRRFAPETPDRAWSGVEWSGVETSATCG